MSRYLLPLWLILAATPAAADLMQLSGGQLSVLVDGLPLVFDPTASVQIPVSSGLGSFTLPAGVFSGMESLPPQLYTGISLLSTLNVTAMQQSIAYDAGSGSATGVVGGYAVLGYLAGLLNLAVPLGLGSDLTVNAGAAALNVTLTAYPGWTTGVAQISAVPTTSTPNAATTTVSVAGGDARTAGHSGTLSLVAATRVITNVTGVLPIFGILTLQFSSSPEPGAITLLAAGALGVGGLLARRRAR